MDHCYLLELAPDDPSTGQALLWHLCKCFNSLGRLHSPIIRWIGSIEGGVIAQRTLSCHRLQGYRKEGRFTHPWQPARLIRWNSVWHVAIL